MAHNFNIGQYRKEDKREYFTNIKCKMDRGKRWIDRGDRIFSYGTPTIIPETTLKGGESYYLSFITQRYMEDIQVFIQLETQEEALVPNNVQIIRRIVIPKIDTVAESVTQFDVVFTPNGDYDKITFITGREIEEDSSSVYVDLRMPKINCFGKFNNIIDENFPAKKVLKLGVQGRRDLLLCLNGEGIRIGRSGFYEMFNNEVVIDFIGVKTDNNINNDYFLIDYQYEEGR